uniref:(northern house mosquito) hypothetical protein n=1 Tax=Culex pipiens TaxID=7175 RepID=A0A8D8AWW6_CULPI
MFDACYSLQMLIQKCKASPTVFPFFIQSCYCTANFIHTSSVKYFPSFSTFQFSLDINFSLLLTTTMSTFHVLFCFTTCNSFRRTAAGKCDPAEEDAKSREIEE